MAYLNPRAGAERQGFTPSVRGKELYVDTVSGSASANGLSWSSALTTVEAAVNLATDNSVIRVVGDVREQFLAPLGIQGVRIVGAAGGNNRHDDGVRWRQSSSAEGGPLLELREQGWQFENILFVPEATYAAVKLHREESATYPDASHAVFRNCKFIGAEQAGTGIEDYGGAHNILVEDCEFMDLEYAWEQTNVSIAAPRRVVFRRNRFDGNKNDIGMNASRCLFQDNLFMDVYHATTHPVTLNLALTADAGTGNLVLHNHFMDTSGNVTIAKGYKPSTGDVWRNYVAGTAAAIVAVPS